MSIPRLGVGSLFAACLLISPAVPADAKPTISGIYSNVLLSPETGDLGGLEIEFHDTQPEPYALVVFCEGWCNQAYRVPVRIRGNRFDFAFTEALTDGIGAPAGDYHYRVNGRLTGRALVVELHMNSYRWRARLKRLDTRFGLGVAHPPTESRLATPPQSLPQ